MESNSIRYADLNFLIGVTLNILKQEVRSFFFRNRQKSGFKGFSGSKIVVPQPWCRRHIGKMFPYLVRLIIMKNFKDTQCGFKLFKKKVGKVLFSELKTKGFAFDVEILYRAVKKYFKTKEIPVLWHNSADSKVSLFKSPLEMFFSIVKIKLSIVCQKIRTGGQYYQYLHFLKRDLDRIESFRLIKNWSYGKILDIGCGIGYLSNYVGVESAIDKDPSVIEKAKEFFPSRNFIVGNVFEMPFADNSYDCVICYNVLEHFSDSDILKIFYEVKRILKNSGFFIVGYSDLTYGFYKILTFLRGKDCTHIQNWNRKKFKKIIQQHFSIEDTKNTSGYGYMVVISKFFKGDMIIKASHPKNENSYTELERYKKS